MKFKTLPILASCTILFVLFAAEALYYQPESNSEIGSGFINQIDTQRKEISDNKPSIDNFEISVNPFSGNISPYIINGFDWSLPPNTAPETKNAGIIGESLNKYPILDTAFLEVIWGETNLRQRVYNFSYLNERLSKLDTKKGEKAVIRLEVHSKCETPAWAMAHLRATKDKSLIFWDSNYKKLVGDFVREFARRYAANPKIIGVQLGIADGEWNGPCSEYGKDGWGEFWMTPEVLHESESKFGLTPQKFEDSTKEIIDIYANAFGEYRYKLAYTNFGPLFSWENIAEPYNQKMTKLGQYAIDKGLGNRDGGAEIWMKFIDSIYGNVITSMPDNTCRLEFSEKYAEKVRGRFWATENEFYGKESYITDMFGPYHSQKYRLLMNTLRTLQMRRNYASINESSTEGLDGPVYKVDDMMKYFSKVIGKQMENTPDAFVLLGEKYVRSSLTKSHSKEACVRNNGKSIPVRSYGRWLVDEGSSTPAIKITMPEEEGYWGQQYSLPDGVDYEYFAREAKQFKFNLNDQLSNIRCVNGCSSEIKITFKDTLKTGLSVEVEEGSTSTVKTTGDGKIKTVTFTVKSQYNNGASGTDILFTSSQGKIPVIMTRVNFL